jgi:hypothetical protein
MRMAKSTTFMFCHINIKHIDLSCKHFAAPNFSAYDMRKELNAGRLKREAKEKEKAEKEAEANKNKVVVADLD